MHPAQTPADIAVRALQHDENAVEVLCLGTGPKAHLEMARALAPEVVLDLVLSIRLLQFARHAGAAGLKFEYPLPLGQRRGQVVIPMKARKALKIKQGDQLIVMSGPPGKSDIISFIPAKRIADFLKHFENRVEALKKELSKQTKK